MKKYFISAIMIFSVIAVRAQSTIPTPANTTFTKSPSDPRSLAMGGGQATIVRNPSWSIYNKCVYWGFPKDTVKGVINGLNTQPPNQACSGLRDLIYNASLSNLNNGLLKYDGTTKYKYTISSGSGYITSDVPVRLHITVTDTLGSPLSLISGDSNFILKINQNFRIHVLLQAFSPSGAMYFSGGPNSWIGAIELFNNLHTDPLTSICTSLDLARFFQETTDVSASNDGPYCSGETAELKSSGATTYKWTGPNGFSSTSNNDNFNTTGYPLNGAFFLTGTGRYNCADTQTTVVIVNPKPNVSFQNSTPSNCFNEHNITLTNNSTISNGSFSTLWNFGDGQTSNLKDENHKYTAAGLYTVKLFLNSDQNCKDSASTSIEIFPSPVNNPTVSQACIGVPVFFKGNSSISSGSLIQLQWKFGDGGSASTDTATHSYAATGAFQAIFSSQSDKGCLTVDTVPITVGAQPTADFEIVTQNATIVEPLIEFRDKSLNPQQWSWTFGDNSSSNDQNPRHKYTDTGNYLVTLIVTSAGGCKDTASQSVFIDIAYTFFIPTGISPNGDGKNEKWSPIGVFYGVTNYHVDIYTENGVRVFESDNLTDFWDGTEKNTGTELPQGVYHAVVVYTDYTGKKFNFNKRITLIR